MAPDPSGMALSVAAAAAFKMVAWRHFLCFFLAFVATASGNYFHCVAISEEEPAKKEERQKQ